MLIEIGNLMEDIINCELIAKKQLIEHSYANLTFEYE